MAEEQQPGVRPFLEVQQEVRRLFQELVHQPWGGQGLSNSTSWQPRCDMVETDEAVLIDVELPGVKREDVRLEVGDDVLNIAGERRALEQRQGRNYHYLEQQYGSFERQLRLPQTVDREAIRADFDNGILSITLPKKQENQD
ncbi:MAG: Hsp20/alpha crystallin family protein [Candidatus Tectomicrobia bacterium]|nr:Hsp20/alpha crystallin family protein [Candidatus Tectomicrobia bacterium]